MKKQAKKMLALVLTLCMLASMLVVSGSAAASYSEEYANLIRLSGSAERTDDAPYENVFYRATLSAPDDLAEYAAGFPGSKLSSVRFVCELTDATVFPVVKNSGITNDQLMSIVQVQSAGGKTMYDLKSVQWQGDDTISLELEVNPDYLSTWDSEGAILRKADVKSQVTFTSAEQDGIDLGSDGMSTHDISATLMIFAGSALKTTITGTGRMDVLNYTYDDSEDDDSGSEDEVIDDTDTETASEGTDIELDLDINQDDTTVDTTTESETTVGADGSKETVTTSVSEAKDTDGAVTATTTTTTTTNETAPVRHPDGSTTREITTTDTATIQDAEGKVTDTATVTTKTQISESFLSYNADGTTSKTVSEVSTTTGSGVNIEIARETKVTESKSVNVDQSTTNTVMSVTNETVTDKDTGEKNELRTEETSSVTTLPLLTALDGTTKQTISTADVLKQFDADGNQLFAISEYTNKTTTRGVEKTEADGTKTVNTSTAGNKLVQNDDGTQKSTEFVIDTTSYKLTTGTTAALTSQMVTTTQTFTDGESKTATSTKQMGEIDMSVQDANNSDVFVAPFTVTATDNINTAPTISVDTTSSSDDSDTKRIAIPVDNLTHTTVAILTLEDGSQITLRECTRNDNMTAILFEVPADQKVEVQIVENMPLCDNIVDIGETSSWARKNVESSIAAKVLIGNEKHEIKPLDDFTRGQLATIAARYDKSENDDSYANANLPVEYNNFNYPAYYMDAANNAVAKGYMSTDEEGKFNGYDPATRYDTIRCLGTVLVSYFGMGVSESEAEDILSQFSDANRIAPAHRIAFATAVQFELTNGIGGGQLGLDDFVTTEQICVMTQRMNVDLYK